MSTPVDGSEVVRWIDDEVHSVLGVKAAVRVLGIAANEPYSKYLGIPWTTWPMTRTIRGVAWMAEEIEIFGGGAYAEQHATEMGNHLAAIETDLGAGHPIGINACCDGATLRMLQPIAHVIETSGAGILRSSEETGADIIPLKLVEYRPSAPSRT